MKKKKKINISQNPDGGVGLFDHIKQIRSIQDPNYFDTLEESDVKSFNHFMILKSLSMNPSLLEDISVLFKFFDKVPSPQFYQLLIGLIPSDKKYYPWIKSKKKTFSDQLLRLFSRYYEISEKESEVYINTFLSLNGGKKRIIELCEDFGKTEKEIKEIMKGCEDE